MLKRLGFALCFAAAFTAPAYSQSVPTSYPIEPVDLVCYIETAAGELTDLTDLCGAGRISEPITPEAPAADPVGAPNTLPAPARSNAALSPETNLGGLNVGGQDGSPLCFGLDAQGRACP
jgi:hypothetical protein